MTDTNQTYIENLKNEEKNDYEEIIKICELIYSPYLGEYSFDDFVHDCPPYFDPFKRYKFISALVTCLTHEFKRIDSTRKEKKGQLLEEISNSIKKITISTKIRKKSFDVIHLQYEEDKVGKSGKSPFTSFLHIKTNV